MSIYQLLTTVFRKRNQVPLFSSDKQMEIPVIVVRTLSMLNSFVNPLIYCMRQKEMRKCVFSLRPSNTINPVN